MERIAPVRVGYAINHTGALPMKHLALPLLILPLALAACSDPSPEPSASATPSLAPMVSESEAMAAPVAPGASEAAPITAATFPAAMRGKWAMSPADCDPTTGADKGALTIGEKSVKFYESVADLTNAKVATPTEVRAVFDYEGEGMKWQRDASYKLEDGGKTLVLTEFGDDAPQGPRRHSRCK
ncbi:hypothetical protein C7W88_08510 [Novosphingobium sp. THN1]|jgi:hypothetical protein|uniref:hypothetical protein n=1 Tax=unclassified Novosphingobium TaxID=2644732 RepID=UPI000E52AAB2|nr:MULTISPECIES: hypothetical protein [unclassified Novosphingobium]AXU19060.1 hypothetical protein C7W88_08510 [Novosphingobium sp. THN1]MBA4087569.1 hypothetical protein [Novosphingobium sp.]NLR38744.1 hypothetical protein [Novosphingobium sp. ERW19]